MHETSETIWGLLTSQTGIASLFTFLGAATMKLLDHFFSVFKSKNELHSNDQQKFQENLIKELDKVREYVKELHNDLDEWKEKYFGLRQEYIEIKGKYELIEIKLKKLSNKN